MIVFISSIPLLPLGAQTIRETLVSLQFLNFRQPVGLLRRGISPSQCRYLTQTDIHAVGGIRTHDHSVPVSQEISSLRHRGH
jgi:hypothetical protein